MTAICKHTKLTAILCTVLAVFMMMSILVVPAFAEDEPSAESTTAAATEPGTSAATEAATTAGTTAGTSAVTTADTKKEAESVAAAQKAQRTRGIINLAVGAVILIAVVVLAIVFRAKIPVWFKAIKSECGKIVWCPKDKLKKNSFVVVVIIVILAIVIGLLDYAFSEGIILLGKLVK